MEMYCVKGDAAMKACPKCHSGWKPSVTIRTGGGNREYFARCRQCGFTTECTGAYNQTKAESDAKWNSGRGWIDDMRSNRNETITEDREV